MNITKLFCIGSLFFSSLVMEAKNIYIPSSFGDMDLQDENSQWCYQRSKQSDNFIIFWEKGFGVNPLMSEANFKVNILSLLNTAEKSFQYYTDTLQFIHPGNSRTDQYKMIILLYYTTDWLASGSGVDDVIGQLNLSASAAQNPGHTLAHEVAHCFQYQVSCDGYSGGWRYGFGPNGSGGNGWWEQCAQWQAFKLYPDQQFSNYQFQNYLNNTHKNVWHEDPRYANYFIPDYWTFLHGIHFIGRLWQESKFPEDPVRAYQRITKISQSEFNDEMYNCAARFATWDIPSLKENGKEFIQQHGSSKLIKQKDNSWIISPEQCIENYGYNTVRLNVPTEGSALKIYFKGLAGLDGYRTVYKSFAGWRYGLVALLTNGERVYSEMSSPEYTSTNGNPKDTLSFKVPYNCNKLWLVVSGAPKIHWAHAWDDNPDNDEQWPYGVSFENTNIYGEFEFPDDEIPENTEQKQFITLLPETSTSNPYPSTVVYPDLEKICEAFKLSLSEVKSKIGTSIKFCAVQPTGAFNYTSTANDPGHWFNRNGFTTNWGNQSFIFSEFNAANFNFSIGQYPGVCKLGDRFTIKQALVYTPEVGEPVEAVIEFRIKIGSEISTSNKKVDLKYANPIIQRQDENYIYFSRHLEQVVVFDLNGREIIDAVNCQQLDISSLKNGIFLVTANNNSVKIYIQR